MAIASEHNGLFVTLFFQVMLPAPSNFGIGAEQVSEKLWCF